MGLRCLPVTNDERRVELAKHGVHDPYISQEDLDVVLEPRLGCGGGEVVAKVAGTGR